MSLKREVEQGIDIFINNMDNLSRDDSKKLLMKLFDKHLHLNTCSYLLDHSALRNTISAASGIFSREKFPRYIGLKRRLVTPDEERTLCIIEATISMLNEKDCLKKLPKFDFRENKL